MTLLICRWNHYLLCFGRKNVVKLHLFVVINVNIRFNSIKGDEMYRNAMEELYIRSTTGRENMAHEEVW